jgi:hypothetical protein
MQTQETLEAMALQLLHKINALYEDAQRMSTDDPAKASRVAKLLSKQLLEIHKLSGSAELPADFTPPVVRMASLAEGARAANALLTYAAEQADSAGDGEEGASEGCGEEEELQLPTELAQVRGGVAAALACAAPARLGMGYGTAPSCDSASDAAPAESRSTSHREAGAHTQAGQTRDSSGANMPDELATHEQSDSQASLVGYLQGMSSQEYGELGLVQSQDSLPPETHELPEQQAISSRASPCPPSQPQSRSPSQASSQLSSRLLFQSLTPSPSQPQSQPLSHPPSQVQSQAYTHVQSQTPSHAQPLFQPPYWAAMPHHPQMSLICAAPTWQPPQPNLSVVQVAGVPGVPPQNTTFGVGVAPSQMPPSCAKAEPTQQVSDRHAPAPTTMGPSKPAASLANAVESAFGPKRPRKHGGKDIMDAANGLRALSALARKTGGASEVNEVAARPERPGAAA